MATSLPRQASSLAILTLLSAALAPVGQAWAQQTRLVPMRQAMPFLDRFYALPADGRDGFALHYKLGRQEGPRPVMTWITNGRRTPVRVGEDGRILNPPGPTDITATQMEVSYPAGAQPGRASITLDVVPVIAQGRSVPVSAVTNALQDYRAAVRRAAGPLAIAAPRLTGVRFKGAGSGDAVMADGRRVALPIDRGAPVFRPGDQAMRGAVSLSFANPDHEAQFVR